MVKFSKHYEDGSGGYGIPNFRQWMVLKITCMNITMTSLQWTFVFFIVLYLAVHNIRLSSLLYEIQEFEAKVYKSIKHSLTHCTVHSDNERYGKLGVQINLLDRAKYCKFGP